MKIFSNHIGAWVALAALAVPCAAWAKVSPSAWITSGMVIQRGQEVCLTGTADAGEVVVAEFDGEAPVAASGKKVKGEFRATADADGRWSLTLPSLRAGGPYVISIAGQRLEDIMVGDVFFCSGQSNMELPVSRVMDKYAAEVDGTVNDEVRMLRVKLNPVYDGPAADVLTDGWKTLNHDNAMDFSAVAYFFAREMQAATGVAIGVVESAVGGSPIEAWMSREQLQSQGFRLALSKADVNADPAYRKVVEDYGKAAGDHWEAVLAAKEGELAQDWKAEGYDDSRWETVNAVADGWACDSLGAFNGAHWFRKTVNVSASQAALPATLRLGALVDADEAWVNGVKVGQTYYQYPPRIYDIPQGALHAGDNVIAVRLVSQNGEPSFVADKYRGIFFGGNRWLCGNHVSKIDLDDNWKHLYAAAMPSKPGIPFFYYTPTVLYNGMVAPLGGMRFAGAVWYQGESNVGREGEYRQMLGGLMANWRAEFHNDGLNFVIIELADFEKPVNPAWRAMQRTQREVAEADPHADWAKCADLGEWNDVHPLEKKTLGRRVAVKMKALLKSAKMPKR